MWNERHFYKFLNGLTHLFCFYVRPIFIRPIFGGQIPCKMQRYPKTGSCMILHQCNPAPSQQQQTSRRYQWNIGGSRCVIWNKRQGDKNNTPFIQQMQMFRKLRGVNKLWVCRKWNSHWNRTCEVLEFQAVQWWSVRSHRKWARNLFLLLSEGEWLHRF